jgi:cytochrome c peroxidase
MERKYVWIYSSYAVAALVVAMCFFVNRWRTAQRHRYVPEDLSAEYAKWGIEPGAMKEFVALPMHLPYNPIASRLGLEMFTSKKIGANSRSCVSCHPRSGGGADGIRHSGVFTRPAYNAVFGRFYLHDGSISNFADLVRCMIEDRRFIGAGTLSNAVANLCADGRIRERFEAHYGKDNFVGTNLVNSIVNFSRTLMTANGPFDRFCGGRDALDVKRLAGFHQFKARQCARCHSGPSLGTRVITDDGMRVPSLRGLAKRNVYQASGRLYSDLAAVVAMMPGSDFGDDDESRLALLAFLRCL